MSSQNDLIIELRAARADQTLAEVAVYAARDLLRQRKEELTAAVKKANEITEELVSGKSRYTLPFGEPPPPVPADPKAETDLDYCSLHGGAFEWTSADLEMALKAACHPLGFRGPESPWLDFAGLPGVRDEQIMEVLRQIWGTGGCLFTAAAGAVKGFTIRGGVSPSFWMGARRSKDAPPTLAGASLRDRVRLVLELPRFTEPVPEEPEKTTEPQKTRKTRK